jgi:mono/diheme cytochrome c family protein
MRSPRLHLGAFGRGVVAGWLVAGVGGGVLAAFILFGGIYNTGASDPHLRIVAWAVHRTMVSSVQRRAREAPPLPPVTAARLISGAREYEAHCIGCHGGPGVARTPWTNALLPTPPFLIDSRTRWTPAELRELIANGVKMSAMPAWGEMLPAAKIDDLVMFLELMPRLTTARFQRLRSQVRALPADPLAASPVLLSR